MKKTIIISLALVAGIACAVDFVGTLAQNGARSVTFTNTSTTRPIWVHTLSVAQTSAFTNTVELIVVKDSKDFRVGTIAMTTDANGLTTLTNPIRVAPQGTFKVQRGTETTNQVVNVWVGANTTE